MSNDMVLDGVLAQDQTQFQSLWSLREMLPEANGKAGSVYKYDVSCLFRQCTAWSKLCGIECGKPGS